MDNSHSHFTRAKTDFLLYFDNGAFLSGIHLILSFVYCLDNNASCILEKYIKKKELMMIENKKSISPNLSSLSSACHFCREFSSML